MGGFQLMIGDVPWPLSGALKPQPIVANSPQHYRIPFPATHHAYRKDIITVEGRSLVPDRS
jgi:hypothetical protein